MRYQIKVKNNIYELEVENSQPDVKIYHKGEQINIDLKKIHSNLYSLILDGKQFRVWLAPLENGYYNVVLNQEALKSAVEDERQHLRKLFHTGQQVKSEITQIRSPMPGLVSFVDVKMDQQIAAGQGLVIIEAMKMENEIKSPVGGKITKILVKQGETLEKDTLLVEIHGDK